MSEISINSNIMCKTFQLKTVVDAELTSVHFPEEKKKMKNEEKYFLFRHFWKLIVILFLLFAQLTDYGQISC